MVKVENLKGAYKEYLTKRELQILELLKEGNSDEEIASELFLSVNTINNHVSNIRRKLDAKNRTQAVVIALRKNIIEL